jgi:hypothetical protein
VRPAGRSGVGAEPVAQPQRPAAPRQRRLLRVGVGGAAQIPAPGDAVPGRVEGGAGGVGDHDEGGHVAVGEADLVRAAGAPHGGGQRIRVIPGRPEGAAAEGVVDPGGGDGRSDAEPAAAARGVQLDGALPQPGMAAAGEGVQHLRGGGEQERPLLVASRQGGAVGGEVVEGRPRDQRHRSGRGRRDDDEAVRGQVGDRRGPVVLVHAVRRVRPIVHRAVAVVGVLLPGALIGGGERVGADRVR